MRFWSTKAATQWGVKMYDFKVFGLPLQTSGFSSTLISTDVTKVIENGRLVIISNGVRYDILGNIIQ